jgi:ribosomal protein L37AE/L43A
MQKKLLNQCPKCHELILTKDKFEVIHCTNPDCNNKVDEKALKDLMKEFSLSTLTIAFRAARRNQKIKRRLMDCGVL